MNSDIEEYYRIYITNFRGDEGKTTKHFFKVVIDKNNYHINEENLDRNDFFHPERISRKLFWYRKPTEEELKICKLMEMR